ncbi:hypothetical protein [Tropicibacter sp. S64]|uniref:hypothetical protein n=1 Tax=Tropicibacter sp. S64 TaxID=3415122 RepID=UPI003C7E8A7A
MTPKPEDLRVHAIGALALVVLLVQWITLYRLVGPLTGYFLPQMHFGSYTSGQFFAFTLALYEAPDSFDLYLGLLQWVDPVFILLYCLWLLKATRPMWLCILSILAYAGLDLAENALLLTYLGDLRAALPLTDAATRDSAMADPGVLSLSTVTSAKLVVGALTAAYTFGRVLLIRRRTQAAP